LELIDGPDLGIIEGSIKPEDTIKFEPDYHLCSDEVLRQISLRRLFPTALSSVGRILVALRLAPSL
jgi:hypothetical protein